MLIETKMCNTEVYIQFHVLPCLPTPQSSPMVDTGLRGSLSDTVLDYEYDIYEYILRRIFIDFGMLFCNFI